MGLLPNISTLDPSKLVASDFIDLHNKFRLAVRYNRNSTIICEYARVQTVDLMCTRTNFPPETQGFLYLNRPQGVHPCAARLRFRICDVDNASSPQESFSKGKDLLVPKGSPWEINFLQLFATRRSVNLSDGLLLDGVLSREAIQQLDSAIEGLRSQKGLTRLTANYIFSFGQPFSVTMSQRYARFTLVDLERHRLVATGFHSAIIKSEFCVFVFALFPFSSSQRQRVDFRL
jgi:hypothetical protein